MKREIKAVCFDLDETLINHNSWLTLGLALGVTKERDQELYDEFKAGKITYEEWNDLVLSEYMKHEDVSREGVTRIFEQYVLSDGAQEAVAYLREKDYEIILISGSMIFSFIRLRMISVFHTQRQTMHLNLIMKDVL
jgi:HAD superfamily phosphoserine phosphatase-like hydrolase